MLERINKGGRIDWKWKWQGSPAAD